MKIFIFSNTSLDSGYLISGEKNKVVELSTLETAMMFYLFCQMNF